MKVRHMRNLSNQPVATIASEKIELNHAPNEDNVVVALSRCRIPLDTFNKKTGREIAAARLTTRRNLKKYSAVTNHLITHLLSGHTAIVPSSKMKPLVAALKLVFSTRRMASQMACGGK